METSINTSSIIEAIRLYEIIKKDLNTLLVKESKRLLDYDGEIEGDEIKDDCVRLEYRANLKLDDNSFRKLGYFLEDLIKHDIVLWSKTERIRKLYLFAPDISVHKFNFEVVVYFKSKEENEGGN